MICKICGESDILSYGKYVNERMQRNSLCHDCNFWDDNSKRDDLLVTDDMKVYKDRGYSNYTYRGFGGVEWIIISDGKEYITNDLILIGTVPERFVDAFEVNAVIRQNVHNRV